MFDLIKAKSCKLISLLLYTEKNGDVNNYYMRGVWEYSNDIGRYELTIPKIDLGINSDSRPWFETEISYLRDNTKALNFITGNVYLQQDEKGVKYYIKELERFEKEMTIEEIEKKLGHKVKIVSK